VKSRIKTHQMPRDVTKQEKQAMLEGRDTDRGITRSQRKSWKKTLLARERTRHLVRNQEV